MSTVVLSILLLPSVGVNIFFFRLLVRAMKYQKATDVVVEELKKTKAILEEMDGHNKFTIKTLKRIIADKNEQLKAPLITAN